MNSLKTGQPQNLLMGHPQTRRLHRFAVGVTGGIGSGKSAVADFFAGKGVCIVDADIAARVVVEPGTPALAAITEHFGDGILTNGQLDRRKLRTIIFASADERKWLETLLHPLIEEQIIARLSQTTSPYAMLVSPLMLETGQQMLVDRVLVVDVPESVQIERTMARDQITEEQARQILNSQIGRAQRLAKAHDVVDNSGSLAQLHQRLEPLHQRYLRLA